MKILGCQIDITNVCDAPTRDRHVARVAGLIGAALAHQHADVVLLPELSSISYSRAAFGNLSELAERETGPTFEQLSAVAKQAGSYIVFGIPRRVGEEYRISQVVIDRHGELVGVYDKTHICQMGASMEQEYFTRGDNLLVFDVDGLQLAQCRGVRYQFVKACAKIGIPTA